MKTNNHSTAPSLFVKLLFSSLLTLTLIACSEFADRVFKFEFEKANISIKYAAGLQIPTKIRIENYDTKKIDYESDTTTVAMIDSDGVIHIQGVGTATITATRSDDSGEQKLTSRLFLTVAKGDQVPLVFARSPLTVGYEVGRKISNVATGGTGTGSITYRIDDTNVATIDSTSGEFTIKSTGTAKVTATQAGDANYHSTENSYILTVKKGFKGKQTGFGFAQTSITVVYEADRKINNRASGGGSTGAISYSIDKENVAKIDAESGELTLKGAGTATITARKAGDANYHSAENSYILTVNKANQTGFSFAQSLFTVAYEKK